MIKRAFKTGKVKPHLDIAVLNCPGVEPRHDESICKEPELSGTAAHWQYYEDTAVRAAPKTNNEFESTGDAVHPK